MLPLGRDFLKADTTTDNPPILLMCIDAVVKLLRVSSMLGTPHAGVHYHDCLAKLSEARHTQLYLEVGVQSGVNLSRIHTTEAIGVDPEFNISADITANKESVTLHKMSGDRFFALHSQKIKARGGVDMAFLDGMHLFEYLLRDFMNTEKVCKRSALVTMHDCLPFNGEMIERVNDYENRKQSFADAWTGDVWKVVNILKCHRPDLQIILLDCHPTGLVCISNLDSTSDYLDRNYLGIVKEYGDTPNNQAAIETFYSENDVIPAHSVLNDNRHTLYFRV